MLGVSTSIIRNINPINWFNYMGSSNEISFSSGSNILVGTNNAGKTKLHNAFRFILTNEVILKVKDLDGDLEYKAVNPNNTKYILEIFNMVVYKLKVNEIGKFGVELILQKRRTNLKVIL